MLLTGEVSIRSRWPSREGGSHQCRWTWPGSWKPQQNRPVQEGCARTSIFHCTWPSLLVILCSLNCSFLVFRSQTWTGTKPPGPPAYRQQSTGPLSLHNHMNQFLIVTVNSFFLSLPLSIYMCHLSFLLILFLHVRQLIQSHWHIFGSLAP